MQTPDENKKTRKKQPVLEKRYTTQDDIMEIGVDEAGRGPMLGRVYSAAVVLPNNDENFKYELMKDSKKFTSKKKITEVADYIKENSLFWCVGYETETTIDKMNIRNATHSAMHKAIKGVIHNNPKLSYFLLVDGNDFKPYIEFDEVAGFKPFSHKCITGGDNKYANIAAASILAKVSRDLYIEELCKAEPLLIERYDLLKNKGYGTKNHIDGIKEYGISQYHRKTFGICRQYS